MASVMNVIKNLLKLYNLLPILCHFGISKGQIRGLAEYCSSDNFSPQCGAHEVIIITHGLYGRMQRGKCLTSNSGLGCSTDVIQQLDSLCSNKVHCNVDVHRAFMVLDNPCPADMLRYLEAGFKCEQVLQIQQSECRSTSTKIEVSSRLSVSSDSLAQAHCGSSSITFTARPGQQLNVSITDFNYYDHQNNRHSCINYLELKESPTGKPQPVCAGSYHRTGHVMTSASHDVTAVFHIQDPQNQRFILSFEAVGCGDITPPEGTWVQRGGDETTLGCHSGQHSWMLSCVNDQWVGAVGSCGTGVSIKKALNPPSKQKSQIAIGMVVFALCSVLLFICSSTFSIGVCFFTKRNEKTPSQLSMRYTQQTLPLVAHNRQQQSSHLPRNQIFIQQQEIVNQRRTGNEATERSSNQTAARDKMEDKDSDQMYCNTMHSQADSIYSDSVKYYVLENLHETPTTVVSS